MYAPLRRCGFFKDIGTSNYFMEFMSNEIGFLFYNLMLLEEIIIFIL